MEDEVNKEAIIKLVEQVYVDECNRGRYTGAMRKALDRYEKLMKEVLGLEFQSTVKKDDWYDKIK